MSTTGDPPQWAILAARIRSELVEIGAVVARSRPFGTLKGEAVAERKIDE